MGRGWVIPLLKGEVNRLAVAAVAEDDSAVGLRAFVAIYRDGVFGTENATQKHRGAISLASPRPLSAVHVGIFKRQPPMLAIKRLAILILTIMIGANAFFTGAFPLVLLSIIAPNAWILKNTFAAVLFCLVAGLGMFVALGLLVKSDPRLRLPDWL